MVGEDVDGGDVEVSFVDAIGAVNNEFVGCKSLDEGGYFRRPGHGYVLITEDGSAKLVTCFVCEDSGVLGVG